MVKTVSGSNHQGLLDWLVQRVTALVMVFYTVGLFVYFFLHPRLAYYEWHSLFSSSWVKVATILFFLCLLAHAWIGIWTVLTDYVKSALVRLILHTFVFLALIVFFFQALLILWSV